MTKELKGENGKKRERITKIRKVEGKNGVIKGKSQIRI